MSLPKMLDADDEWKMIVYSKLATGKPNIEWKDIVGLEEVKKTLAELAIVPTKFHELFTGLRAPRGGILLYGVRIIIS